MHGRPQGMESDLSRRERQIMDVIYRKGEASVAEIIEQIPEPPTSGAARRMLNILEAKGLVVGRYDGPRKIYRPAIREEEARSSALDHVVSTYFRGSVSGAMAALLESSQEELSDEELEMIAFMIDEARKESR